MDRNLAYFAPLVLLPIIVDQAGKYLTRCGDTIEIDAVSTRHAFACIGTYANGITDAWHRSGRLLAGALSDNDIVSKAS